jgi:Tfp pilus assembly protein PilO
MEQSNIQDPKHNLFFKVLFILILSLVVIQLAILSDVGTKGERLGQIKNSQSLIKVENEILKAKVMALKSNQAVLDGLNNHVDVITKPINFIDPEVAKISAQN